MGWYVKPEEKICIRCQKPYDFYMDTMFMARNGHNTCPKCNDKRVEDSKVNENRDQKDSFE